MVSASSRSSHRTTARCPHCLSQKALLRVPDDLPLFLRIWGGHMWCDACLRHYFQLRLVGILLPMAEPKGWERA